MSSDVGNSSNSSSEHRSCFKANQVIGPSIYHFGIVDFLQDWTFQKEIERNFKIYVNRSDPEGISVMEPIAYKLRFQTKMDQIFELDDEAIVLGDDDSEVDSRGNSGARLERVPLLLDQREVRSGGAVFEDGSVQQSASHTTSASPRTIPIREEKEESDGADAVLEV